MEIMKMRTNNLKNKALFTSIRAFAITGMVAGVLNARADINMTLTDPSTYSVTDVGLTGADGTVLPANQYYIGAYGFTVNTVGTSPGDAQSGLSAGSQFNAVCLSPNGEIYSGYQYNFTYSSLSGASPGLNPGNYWAPNGIQDAAYLWNYWGGTKLSSFTSTLFGSSVNSSLTGGKAQEGAALALAMLDLLYNGGSASASYAISSSINKYAPNFNGDGQVQYDYNALISWYLANADSPGTIGESQNTLTYGILVPDAPADGGPGTGISGQEFMFISPDQSNLTPVPEPTTLISGALLLLPFGASTLRILRKKSVVS
jgi:hypothetical protein